MLAARSSLITSVPPCKLVASPSDETVTSAVSPECANGGSEAVTTTAATLRVRTSCEVVVSPNVWSTFWIVFEVNTTEVESPLWLSPVTMPYPTSWLVATPCTRATSLSRTGCATAATGTSELKMVAESRAVPKRAHGERCISTSRERA